MTHTTALVRRLAITLSATLGLVLPWAAHAQAGWQPCGNEGQTCNVYGPATVRYGAEGEYAYRNVNGPIRCSNDLFGDPARGDRKQCAYRMGHNQSPDDRHPGNWSGGWNGANAANEQGWEKCADENEHCSFQGTREVRFGAAGRYAVRTVTGGIDCNSRTFGDPNPGVRKLCMVQENSNWGGGYNRPPVSTDHGEWQFCAEENAPCRPPRGATVRFGANGRYAYMNQVRDEVACHVRTFGDPIQGERKRCEYSTDSNGNWGRTGNNRRAWPSN